MAANPFESAAAPPDPFSQGRYTIKRPFWSFFERTFRVFSPEGALVFFVRHPLLKFRQEWQVFADEARTVPLLHVKARQVLAFTYTYDVTDLRSGERIGVVRAKQLKSLLRDSFEILDLEDRTVGHVEERGHALLRRFLPILTSKHDVEVGGAVVATVRQRFRFFIKEFDVDLTANIWDDGLDPRFILVCALMAVMNEARREQN